MMQARTNASRSTARSRLRRISPASPWLITASKYAAICDLYAASSGVSCMLSATETTLLVRLEARPDGAELGMRRNHSILQYLPMSTGGRCQKRRSGGRRERGVRVRMVERVQRLVAGDEELEAGLRVPLDDLHRDRVAERVPEQRHLDAVGAAVGELSPSHLDVLRVCHLRSSGSCRLHGVRLPEERGFSGQSGGSSRYTRSTSTPDPFRHTRAP